MYGATKIGKNGKTEIAEEEGDRFELFYVSMTNGDSAVVFNQVQKDPGPGNPMARMYYVRSMIQASLRSANTTAFIHYHINEEEKKIQVREACDKDGHPVSSDDRRVNNLIEEIKNSGIIPTLLYIAKRDRLKIEVRAWADMRDGWLSRMINDFAGEEVVKSEIDLAKSKRK